ncbi:MAG: prolyl oligopeptidase family serine peptidase [Bryobacteraceae bacterium]|nr:prolyl oligopeptidase family serine peptidase [Bryobacteraceae bacterium]
MKFAAILLCAAAFAQVKTIPPPGIAIPDAARAELTALLAEKRARFHTSPDLQVRWKAVDWALRYNEFFKLEEIEKAKQLLDERFGQPGLIVHGFKSEIDDSVQPYGLVVPPSWSPHTKGKWRVDIWLHGRGETITELNFIHQRLSVRGEFAPADTFVLHPFGRYCNAYKFAGETDVFEALADLRKRYRIDPDRIAIRGFSMGGAGAWHIAAHHPGEFAAANPGAGFIDTEEYLKGRLGDVDPWVRKLWTMNNAKEYALNFFNLPVVAYSGEEDAQKAAADIMARELLSQAGITLTHVIGPKTGHKYEPGAKREVERRFDALMERGRQPQPRVRFATYTTRHYHSHWVLVHELLEHWKRAEVDAEIAEGGIRATTANVGRVEFYFGPGDAPFVSGKRVPVTLNGKTFDAPPPRSDRSWNWISPGSEDDVHKRPGLQGPIDDAFYSRFVMARPAESAPAWVKSEFERAVREWRKIFRGEPILMDESEVTPEVMRSANVVLWGTPATSKLMVKYPAPKAWPNEADRFLAAIFPNPDAPRRYLVWNSSITFREEHSTTNAQQTAKLPDWAVLEAPYKVVSAGFFNESWK